MRPVDSLHLVPGDLVFFADNPRNPGTIHHVGMYIGRGLMVEAPHTGAVVRTSSIWRSSYAGAVRPAPEGRRRQWNAWTMRPTLRTSRLLLAPLETGASTPTRSPLQTVAEVIARSSHTFQTSGRGLWSLRLTADSR